ncbi:MAG: glycerophosphodiester phosphodiesterase [Nitriliruptorales bacterium]
MPSRHGVHAAVVALLTLALVGAGDPVATSLDNPWLERRPVLIAHQGGEREAPSNTLFAFKTALLKGTDVLELDVFATRDRELVAIHDTTVDRTTDGTGFVNDLTLDEIKQLDAAYWFAPDCGACHDRPESDYVYRGIATGETPPPKGFEPSDFTIPTLREVLETFPDTFINIEVKRTTVDNDPEADSTGYEAELVALLREFGRSDDVIVVSFHDQATATFKALAPEVSTALGLAETAAFFTASGGSLQDHPAPLAPAPGAPFLQHHAIQPPITFPLGPVTAQVVSEDLVADAHAHGLAVHVWLNESEENAETYAWLLDVGVDGIMTSRPSRLADFLDRGCRWPDGARANERQGADWRDLGRCPPGLRQGDRR